MVLVILKKKKTKVGNGGHFALCAACKKKLDTKEKEKDILTITKGK